MEPILSGLQVLELAEGDLSAAAVALAALGARVVRVEQAPRPAPNGAASAMEVHAIALDLDDRAGRRVLLDLLLDADVVLTDLSEQRLAELRAGPEHVLALNDRARYVRLDAAPPPRPEADSILATLGYAPAARRHLHEHGAVI